MKQHKIDWLNKLNSESIIYQLLISGELIIDSSGRFWKYNKKGKIRAEHRLPNGYLQLRKMKSSKRHNVMAHRIAYMHFFQQIIPEGYVINHKNGIKDDNRGENIETCTYSENAKHSNKHGLKDQRGEKNPASKLSSHDVAIIRLSYYKGGITQKELGIKFGVSFKTISKIVRGERRSVDLGITGDYIHRRKHNNYFRNDKGQFEHKSGSELGGKHYKEFPS